MRVWEQQPRPWEQTATFVPPPQTTQQPPTQQQPSVYNEPGFNPDAPFGTEGQYDISQLDPASSISDRMNALTALAYPAAFSAYDIAGETVGADELFDAARRPLDRSFTQMQAQNMEDLNRMGILSGGTAGVYGENTPFQQTNRSYMDTLAALSGWAAIQAPQMALSNWEQAIRIGTGVQDYDMRQYQDYADQTYSNQMDAWRQSQADAAADAARWSGYGQMAGQAFGTVASLALAAPTGGLSLTALPAIWSDGGAEW